MPFIVVKIFNNANINNKVTTCMNFIKIISPSVFKYVQR
nr:MAG TPA: hypothetical protein [Herelleviridae sp.]DAV19726.1 MAG TPA: hypothetical protein [Herelleviridae sp.]